MRNLAAVVLFVLGLLARSGPALGQMVASHPPRGPMPAGHDTGEHEDLSAPDPALPPGQIVAQILTAQEVPAPGTAVDLVITHESVAEGTTDKVEHAVADAAGTVTFGGLLTGSGYSFRVTVDQAPARYASPAFGLGRDSGHHVTLHVFPATSAIDETMVAGQVLLYFEPRDDVFQVSVLLELFNIGETTWVPRDAGFRLPEGWKAFTPENTEGTISVEAASESVNLVGSVGPGRHNVTFSVQVPRDDTETASIGIGLPPRIAGVRIMVESSPQMRLAVAGFPEAISSVNRAQERILVTQVEPGRGHAASLDHIDVRIDGLTTRGNGRWAALMLALGVAGGGVWVAARSRDGYRGGTLDAREATEARTILFAEFLSVEKAHRAGTIGPETHRQAQDVLANALVRIDAAPKCSTGTPKSS